MKRTKFLFPTLYSILRAQRQWIQSFFRWHFQWGWKRLEIGALGKCPVSILLNTAHTRAGSSCGFCPEKSIWLRQFVSSAQAQLPYPWSEASDRSQTQKDTYSMTPFTWKIQKGKFMQIENWFVPTKGWGEGRTSECSWEQAYFWGDGNVLWLLVMIAQLCEYMNKWLYLWMLWYMPIISSI